MPAFFDPRSWRRRLVLGAALVAAVGAIAVTPPESAPLVTPAYGQAPGKAAPPAADASAAKAAPAPADATSPGARSGAPAAAEAAPAEPPPPPAAKRCS